VDTALVVALIAGAVSAVGWVANYALSARADRRRQTTTAALEYVERQLAELYGPLAFLVLEGQSSFDDLLSILGRRFVFMEDQALPEEERKLWDFWVDNDFMPRNEAIQKLLSSKAHLIEGSEMPTSYREFVEYYNSWRMSHLRWKQEGIPYAGHAKHWFPVEFNEEVLKVFEDLKREHSKLVGRITTTPGRQR
jgi:hypothetical protein